MKKVLCLLLCMVMLLGVLVACTKNETPSNDDPKQTTGADNGGTTAPDNGGNNGGTTAPDNGGNNGGTTAPDNGGTTAPDNGGNNNNETTGGATTLPPVNDYTIGYGPEDFGDADGTPRTYNVLVRQSRHAWFWGTQESKDVVSVAAYKRNQKLNQLYNIEMTIQECASTTSDWRTALDVADGEIDLAIPDYWWGLEYEGFFINLIRRPEINDGDAHWVQGWNNNLVINHRLYTITGDAALELMENWEVIFYNRDYANDQNYYEDIITLVENDQWTMKEMLAFIDLFEADLMDTDDSNDVWGAVYDNHSMTCQLYSAGLTLLKTQRVNNSIKDISNTEKNINLTDDVRAIRHHNAVKYYADTARGAQLSERNNLFFESKSFFFATYLLNGRAIKNAASFDFGVLIMPKYDEGDDYVTSSYGVSFFAIPHSASDKHVSSVVLNTMNWLSNTEHEDGMGDDRLVYVYFESVVKGEVANKDEDFAMLDRIKNSAYYDFGFVVSGTVGLESGFEAAVENDESITVTMAEVAKKAEDGILEMMEYYGRADTAD